MHAPSGKPHKYKGNYGSLDLNLHRYVLSVRISLTNRTLRRPFIKWNVLTNSINRYDYQRRLLQPEFEIENEVEELTAKLLDEGQLGTSVECRGREHNDEIPRAPIGKLLICRRRAKRPSTHHVASALVEAVASPQRSWPDSACLSRCQSPHSDPLKRGMSSKREPESPDRIAEAHIQAALGKQAGTLDLSGLGLTTLPESLGKLSPACRAPLFLRQSAHEPAGVARTAPCTALPFRQSAHEPAGVARQAERPARALPFRQSAHEPAGVARQAEGPANDSTFPAISSRACQSRSAT